MPIVHSSPLQGGAIYNLHLTAEQIEFRDTVRDFVRDKVKPAALRPARLEPFAKPLLTDLLAEVSGMGLRALSLAEVSGGAGADHHTACIVIEELAQGDPDIAVVLAHTAVVARMLFDETLSDVQRVRHLPAFIADPACHLAYTGADAEAGLAVDYHRVRSESAAAPITAVKSSSGDWVVNGQVAVVPNAAVAKLFVVKAGALSLLVPRATAGLTVHEASSDRGGASVRWSLGAPGRVTLRDCKVSGVDAVEGDIQARYAQRVVPLLAAANIGVGQAAFEAAVDYTKLRRQGGKKTIEHQAIGTLLADMAIKLEAARDLVWKAAWALDHPQAIADRSVSGLPLHHMARAHAAELMVEVTERAAECFGAMGVMRDMPLQKYVDDALMFKHGAVSVSVAKLLVAEAVAGFERTKQRIA